MASRALSVPRGESCALSRPNSDLGVYLGAYLGAYLGCDLGAHLGAHLGAYLGCDLGSQVESCQSAKVLCRLGYAGVSQSVTACHAQITQRALRVWG